MKFDLTVYTVDHQKNWLHSQQTVLPFTMNYEVSSIFYSTNIQLSFGIVVQQY